MIAADLTRVGVRQYPDPGEHQIREVVVEVQKLGAGGNDAPAQSVHTGRIVAISLVAALGGFLFGYDSSVINGANQAIFYEFQIANGFFEGFVVAIALLGSAVGAYIGGRLADKYGRKRVMLVAAVIFLVAGVGTAFPPSITVFMGWRVLGGVAVGLAAVISPLYISEMAPAHLRGRMSSFFQLAVVVGIFSTQLVNELLVSLVPDQTVQPVGDNDVPAVVANNDLWLGLQAWQWMFLLMAVPAIIYFVLASRLPESPRFLVAANRDDEARAVMSTIYVNDADEKVAAIAKSLAGEHKPSMRDIRGHKFGLQPIVWIGISLAVLQQFVGINAVFYYSNLVWGAIGFDESQAFETSTIVSAVNVVFTVVAIALVDRVGRKPLLLVGSVGMLITLGILTATFISAPGCTQSLLDAGTNANCSTSADLNNPLLSSSQGWVAVGAMMAYVAFFAATWGPVVWVLLGEMFPNKMRAAALSVAVMANWIANFIVSMSFPGLVQISLGIAYGLFTVGALVSFFYVRKYVKETKGVELEDMDALEGVELRS